MASLHTLARAAKIKDGLARTMFNEIIELVKSGQHICIHNFGTFFPGRRKGRTIFSPQIPGGKAVVPDRTVMRFRPSPKLKKILNESEAKAAAKPKAAPAPKAAPKAKAAAKTKTE